MSPLPLVAVSKESDLKLGALVAPKSDEPIHMYILYKQVLALFSLSVRSCTLQIRYCPFDRHVSLNAASKTGNHDLSLLDVNVIILIVRTAVQRQHGVTRAMEIGGLQANSSS